VAFSQWCVISESCRPDSHESRLEPLGLDSAVTFSPEEQAVTANKLHWNRHSLTIVSVWQDPKFEVVDMGCRYLCMKWCSDKKVVIMPYEKACCGCVNVTWGVRGRCRNLNIEQSFVTVNNRVTSCDNCFGLFGQITVHIQSPSVALLFV